MFDIPSAIEAGSNLISKILDKVAPDADLAERNRMTLALTEMQNEYNSVLAQVNVNNTEASSSSVFVAGWRPFIGWVGGSGLAYQVVLMPVVNGMLLVFGYPAVFPGIDINLLQTLIGGMLGLGIARSWDKSNGAETKRVGK
jgi:hypothetical protein